MPIFVNPATGERFENVPDEEAERARTEFGLIPAEEYDAQQRSGGFVDQLKTVPETAAAAVMDTTQGILQSTLYPELKRPSNEALAEVAAESGAPIDPFSAQAQERRQVNPAAAVVGGLAADVVTGAVVPGGLVGRAIATGLVSEGAETAIRGDEYSMTDAGLYGLIGGGIEGAGTLALGAAMRASGRFRNALDATVERARQKGVRGALDATPGPEQASQFRRHADDLYEHFDEELSAALTEVDDGLATLPERLFSTEALRKSVAPNARAQADQTLELAAQLDQIAQVTGNPRMREAATILEAELDSAGPAQFSALRTARNQLVDVAEESPLIREAIEAIDGSLGNEGIWGKAARNYTNAATGLGGEPAQKFTVREMTGRETLEQRLERAREVAQLSGNERLGKAVKRAEDALEGADKVTGAKVMGGPGDADEIEVLRKKVADFETRSAELADEARANLEGLDKRIDGDLTNLADSYRRVSKIVARDDDSVAKQMQWGGQVADGADALRGRLGTPRPSAVTRESTESAYSLEGKTLQDLGHRETQAEKLEAVRADEKFRGGRVEGDEEGISLIDDPQLGLRMNDGRHRFTVAKERGERSVYGTVRDPESGEILFRGDIPLEGAPAGSRRRVVEYATATDPAIAELLSLPGIKTHASKLDSTLAAMSQSVRQAKNTEQLFKAIYQGKQALQKLVKGMGQALSQTSGLAEQQGIEALQAMAEEYQNSVLQGLYRRELWGDAAEFMAGINKALHEKIIPASAAVSQDFERFLGREYLTNKPISTWAPEKIRAHFSARMKGSTTADEQLKRWLSGAEDAIATHRKWGTADPRELARAEAQVTAIRKALTEVDEIPVAARRVKDFDAQPQSLVDKLMAKGGAKLASKVIGGAAGFVAGGPVGAIAGGLAGEAFEPIVESAMKSRGRGVAARVKAGLQKLVERERAPLGAVLRDETAQATLGKPSPGAQRVRDIIDKRRGQSGGIVLEDGTVRAGPGIRGVLASPMGDAIAGGVGATVGGAFGGEEGMMVGGASGLLGSVLLGRRAVMGLSKLRAREGSWLREILDDEAGRVTIGGSPAPRTGPLFQKKTLARKSSAARSFVVNVVDPIVAKKGVTPEVVGYIERKLTSESGITPLERKEIAQILKSRMRDAAETAVTAPEGVNYFAERIGQNLGQTPGGFYRGSDGVERYVKQFPDATLPQHEVANSRMYRDFGVDAVQLEIAKHPERGVALLSRRLDPKWKTISESWDDLDAISPEAATEYVRGVPADIVIGNWDMAQNVGNLMTDGAKVIRIDVGEAGPVALRARDSRFADPEMMWNEFKDSVQARTKMPEGTQDVMLSRLDVNRMSAVKSTLQDGIAGIDQAVEKAGGMRQYVAQTYSHLDAQDQASLAGKFSERLQFVRNNVNAIATMMLLAGGAAMMAPSTAAAAELDDDELAAIEELSATGMDSSGIINALQEPEPRGGLGSLGFDEDESAALGFLDEQGLTIDQIDELLDPQKLAERAERRLGLQAVRQKLGYLATQARTAITSVARAMASPSAAPRAIQRIPNVTSSAGIQRFMASHETVREAYEDKRAMLQRLESDPMLLVDELTTGLDELSETAPELHAQTVAQTYKVAQFLQSKLPATIGASLARPDGSPPNMLAVRQFALYYSAATDPSSVLDDLANNRARREQVETLRELWPDTYQAVKAAVLDQMTKARPRVAQRMRLDLLMDFGDALDTGLSWRLAALVQGQGQEQGKPPARAPERRTQPSIRNTNATAALSGALA